MVSKKYWKKTIIEFTNLVSSENETKFVNILGISFAVCPGVFSPIYSSDTAWFAEKLLKFVKNKKFLEIGAGSGIIACVAAMHGAINVTATDINDKATGNILLNSQLHSLSISVREGCLFNPIKNVEKYDLIFWNHPFYCLEEDLFEGDKIAMSVFDTDYRYLRDFFANGKNHLEKNGQLILGTSNVARINLIKTIAKEEGYAFELVEKTVVPIFKDKSIKMDLRLYSFTLRDTIQMQK